MLHGNNFFFFFPSNSLQACLYPKPKPPCSYPCLGKDLISYLYIKISIFLILPNIMWLDLIILSFEDQDIISNIMIFDILLWPNTYLYLHHMCFILSDLQCYGSSTSSSRNHLWSAKEFWVIYNVMEALPQALEIIFEVQRKKE